MKIPDITLPEKLGFLLDTQMRYKVARGGRGSAKSWSFARALLFIGLLRKIRVLCAREVQRSIKDSVHRLLNDQITLMGLEDFYTVTDTEIRGLNGTIFLFTGLVAHTAHTLKSFEGVDYCWVEEGQAVSERSWKILTPTIRAPGSEIWITYNPELESDPTHQRFTIRQPENCINVFMNYPDNPWFYDSDELEKERLMCLRDYPEDYPNIWEGKCRPAVEGAIYYKEIEKAIDSGRICPVPNDPILKTHIVADIGFNDETSIGLFQIHGGAYRLTHFYESNQAKWSDDSKNLRDLGLNWGRFWLPHDGHAKRKEAHGISSAETLRKLGWDVPMLEEMADLGIEEGIKHTRQNFDKLYIDEGCKGFIEHIKRYRRHIIRTTESAGSPVHDDHSHAADMLRYFMVNSDRMTNDDYVYKPPPVRAVSWATL